MSEHITPVAGNLLTDYQAKAMTTAKLTALSLDYLIPGLISEIGEVFGVQAKAIRDGWSPKTLKGEMTKEMGDVAWMTAVALRELGEDTIIARKTTVDMALKMTKGDPHEVFKTLAYVPGKLYRYYQEGDLYSMGHLPSMGGELRGLWLFMQGTQHLITGRDFPTVLAYNLDKLQARAARGVIGGSGDNR